MTRSSNARRSRCGWAGDSNLRDKSAVASGQRDEIAASAVRGIDERAACRRARLKAVALLELVLGVSLAEAKPAVEHPDLLVDEDVRIRRVADLRAGPAARPRRARAARHSLETALADCSRSPDRSRSAARPRARGVDRRAPRARSSSESVIPNAPDRRPRRAAVGWASARSTFAIIARETPERSASALVESPCATRAAWTAAASGEVS